MLQAIPLNAMTSASAESDQAAGLATSGPSASCPENRTWSTPLSAASEKAIARPATAIPAAGSEDEGPALEDALGLAGEPQDQEDAHRASYRQGDRPSEVAHVRAGEGGQVERAERVVASS